MIAGGSHIEPTVGGAEKGVRSCSHRHVLGSLWDPDLKPGGAGSAAETARGVLTLHRSNRIHIHRGRDVIVPPLIEMEVRAVGERMEVAATVTAAPPNTNAPGLFRLPPFMNSKLSGNAS